MKKLAILLAAVVFILVLGTTSATAEEHKVEKGDNLSDIANDYDVDVIELMYINELDTTVIQPEQVLDIDEDALKEQKEDKSSDDSDRKSVV